MSETYDFLINIPWWVYLIFFYCIFIGIKSLKTSVIHISKFFIIPIIFIYLSLHTLLSSFSLNFFIIFTYIISLLAGICLGVILLKRSKIIVDSKNKLIKVSGSWVTLVLILITFFSKFYIGYELGVDPKIVTNKSFDLFFLLVSGVTSGMFLGRLIYVIFKMMKGPFKDLSKK